MWQIIEFYLESPDFAMHLVIFVLVASFAAVMLDIKRRRK